LGGKKVTVGPLALFSTETGDAWLLDPADHLAARVARDGGPEEIDFEETETSFAIGWKGNYQIDGDAFVFIDRDTARITTVLGYPTRRPAFGRARTTTNCSPATEASLSVHVVHDLDTWRWVGRATQSCQRLSSAPFDYEHITRQAGADVVPLSS
jgi:hypothetical protein